MIDEIRSYFKQVVKEIDPSLKQHDQYFISDDIPDSRLENTYFLKFGALSTDRDDESITGQMPITLEFWKNGYNETLENLDKAYCTAIDIQSTAMNQRRIIADSYIKSVLGTSISPSPVLDNDNLGKFSLEFTVTVKHKPI